MVESYVLRIENLPLSFLFFLPFASSYCKRLFGFYRDFLYPLWCLTFADGYPLGWPAFADELRNHEYGLYDLSMGVVKINIP